jgi:RNA polymerase sigma-70 factor, ECF subfamily
MQPAGFEEMYREHYRMLRSAAFNIIRDRDASHDVVQEVFVKLWNKKDDIHTILNRKAYLFKAVVNASITYLHNKKDKNPIEDYKLASDGATDSGIMMKELELKIAAALDTLPPKCRAVFVLSRFEEKKNREIADILGLSIKTVENQMGIALKKMRAQLQPYLSKEIITLGFSAGLLLMLIL